MLTDVNRQLRSVFPHDDPDGKKAQEELQKILGVKTVDEIKTIMKEDVEELMPVKKYQIAIDPGNAETAIVVVEIETKKILFSAKLPNTQARSTLGELYVKYGGDWGNVAIEMIASYGMPVGKSVFDTCLWIGRYIEICGSARLITRIMVKSHMCHSAKATDANIRQALMDRYGSTKEAAIGTKKMPGPMYGMGNDERAALAVALTAIETRQEYEMSKSDE